MDSYTSSPYERRSPDDAPMVYKLAGEAAKMAWAEGWNTAIYRVREWGPEQKDAES